MDSIFYKGQQKDFDLFSTAKNGWTKDKIDICKHIGNNPKEKKDKTIEVKRAIRRKKPKER